MKTSIVVRRDRQPRARFATVAILVTALSLPCTACTKDDRSPSGPQPAGETPKATPVAGKTAEPGTTGPTATEKSPAGPAVRPTPIEATDARIESLHVPAGFAVNVFARNVVGARMLATGDDGTIYVAQTEPGGVRALKDADGDGRSDRSKLVAAGLRFVHGLAVRQGELWLATPTEIHVASIESNGTLGPPQRVMKGLPKGKEHPLRTIAIGPDDTIYLSVGSSCNACIETDPRQATILRIGGEGQPVVFARGLRDTTGFDWHPDTHELWGMDSGTEGRGNDLPPEELNRLKQATDYGWPYVFGKRQIDEAMDDPPSTTKEKYAATTEPSVLEYQAHSGPVALRFYRGTQFPAEYRGDAFVAMHGSWDRDPPTGYKVVRIRFDHGTPKGFEDFLTGFLVDDGKTAFGRPAGLTIAQDGALLVADDLNGIIYRVTYTGPAGGAAAGAAAK